MNKQLLRVGEAADALAVSRWTIYRWVEEGRLKGPRLGAGSLECSGPHWTGWCKTTRRRK